MTFETEWATWDSHNLRSRYLYQVHNLKVAASDLCRAEPEPGLFNWAKPGRPTADPRFIPPYTMLG